jgi:hypothetical protein
MRRLIPVLTLAIAALVAGCGTDTGDSATSWGEPATSATAAADPVAAIKKAAERSLSGTVAMTATVKVGGTTIELTGKADPKAKTVQVTGKAPEPIEARQIGETIYLKMDGLPGGKPWAKIDVTKLRPTSSLRQSFDLQAQTGIIAGIVSAEEAGAGRYTGKADLAKAAEAASANPGMRDGLESTVKLAKDPKAIPFEATVDKEGRLTALSYTVATKELGDMSTKLEMSDFGEPVKVNPPSGSQVADAPKELYAVL